MAKRQQHPVLPLAMVIDEYQRDLRRQRKSPKTIDGYRKVLKLVLAFLIDRRSSSPTLDDFTVKRCEAFFDHLLERGKVTPQRADAPVIPLAQETLRTYTRTLKAFASWLAAPKQQYTPDNRLQYLALPQRAETYKLPLACILTNG